MATSTCKASTIDSQCWGALAHHDADLDDVVEILAFHAQASLVTSIPPSSDEAGGALCVEALQRTAEVFGRPWPAPPLVRPLREGHLSCAGTVLWATRMRMQADGCRYLLPRVPELEHMCGDRLAALFGKSAQRSGYGTGGRSIARFRQSLSGGAVPDVELFLDFLLGFAR